MEEDDAPAPGWSGGGGGNGFDTVFLWTGVEGADLAVILEGGIAGFIPLGFTGGGGGAREVAARVGRVLVRELALVVLLPSETLISGLDLAR